MNDEKKVCKRCQINRAMKDYYTTRLYNEDYPDGRLDVCKICISNNFKVSDPGTFMHVLYALDYPWIPVEFQNLAAEYTDKLNPNNIGILGRYLSMMRLNQYKKYGFMDSQAAQEESGGEETWDSIENYAYKTPVEKAVATTSANDETMVIDVYQGQSAQDLLDDNEGDISNPYGLTREEMEYLVIKWGTFYTPEELVTLERKYAEMLANFEIETAIHRDYLKKLCTVSMQYDNAIATVDIDAAAKISNMYSRITRESGFQPSQNDSGAGDHMDSVGHIVRMVEEQGPIPQYDIDVDPDLADLTLKDLKMFNLNLVRNDDSIMERNAMAMEELREQDEMVERSIEEDEEIDYNDPLHAIDMSDFDDLEEFDDRE